MVINSFANPSIQDGSDTSSESIDSRTKNVHVFLENIYEWTDNIWTKRELDSTFQDSNYSSTDLNIQKVLSNQNPLLEIENAFIDIIGIDIDDNAEDDQYDNKIYQILNRYNALAIMVISNLIDSERVKFLQAIKILSILGKIRHFPTYFYRTWILEKNLLSNSKYIRDGASLGLLYLENPSTLKSLQTAIDRETSKQLKINMIQVINELGENLHAKNLPSDTE